MVTRKTSSKRSTASAAQEKPDNAHYNAHYRGFCDNGECGACARRLFLMKREEAEEKTENLRNEARKEPLIQGFGRLIYSADLEDIYAGMIAASLYGHTAGWAPDRIVAVANEGAEKLFRSRLDVRKNRDQITEPVRQDK